VTFKNGAVYSELYVVGVMEPTLTAKRSELRAFLRGLSLATAYTAEHPKEAQVVVARHTKLDLETVAAIWPNFVFKPAITRRFVDYTTAEAKWAIEKDGASRATSVPDFAAVLYPELLREVVPEAVHLDSD